MAYSSARFFFSSLPAAVEALATVLDDARYTEHHYSFGSLSVSQVFSSGLMLAGEIDVISAKLEAIEGVSRVDD